MTPIFNALQPSKMAAALYRTQLVEKLPFFNKLLSITHASGIRAGYPILSTIFF